MSSSDDAVAIGTTPVHTRPSLRSQGRSGQGWGRVSNRRGPLAVLGIYLGLGLAAIIMVLPFLFSFMTAFKSPRDFASHSPLAPPDPWTLDSFAAVLGGRIDFASAIWTTLAMVAVMVVAQIGSSVMAAYAFARLSFPGRDIIFWIFLATMMLPSSVLVIPLYLMMAKAGMNNTFWGIVIPFMLASPYAVFLLRENFRSIPQELIDAARVDGAGHVRTLLQVVLPISRPILATLTLITVVSQWNSFMWPRVIASQRPKVITVATAALQSQYNANWTYVMSATTIALVPLIILFITFQKQIVASIVLTGLK
ncbi:MULTISPECIES: carbohydrate ABC transporter permease [unclassified Actinomyces]|uniref:carbohydrate ABC transporter permease n=1 Tax=unclassified Actinomyces TaxID=2609248 RepID=UPI000D595194|nr:MULTISPECIES: carbohydrate ABC transporter permease [unclassified Actinomyces]RAX20041.1 carbohydrate ABC transporter permease [Actinomyces sp. Z5]RAX22510.1 carbohydrate ABC transporter permease [Actinomyces sp. Z3]